MDKTKIQRVLLLLTIALLLVAASAVHAQSGGGTDLSWWTASGGGTTVEGGGITLRGTAGQPYAGPALSGGRYALVGGFWPGQLTPEHRVYLPVVLRNR